MKINAQEVSNIIMPCSFLAEEAISVFSESVDNIFCFKDVLVSVYGTGVDSYMLWRLCAMQHASMLCQGDRSNGFLRSPRLPVGILSNLYLYLELFLVPVLLPV